MTFEELEELIAEHIPTAVIEEGRDGQVIIFTGLKVEDDELVPMDGDIDSDSIFDDDTESLDEDDSY